MAPSPMDDSRTLRLLRESRKVLESMALDHPLDQVLRSIIRLIEGATGCRTALFYVEGEKLRIGASLSFSADFIEAIDGGPVGPNAGACGHAAHCRARVIVTDTRTDPRMGTFRELVFEEGILAVWSTPIFDETAHEVVAAFNMCWPTPRTPTEWDLEVMEAATRLVTLAMERKRTGAQIAEQQLKLASASKLAALGEMSASLAHEINNPLAIIQSHADQLRLMAQLAKLDPAKVRTSVEHIERTVERMTRIVRGLRNFSRDADQDPFENASWPAILEQTLSFCTERFAKHGVSLELPELNHELRLRCRPVQISQVLLNLLNNAFDAARAQPEKWVRIEATADAENCRIRVLDSGRGVPASLQGRIMEPFFTTKQGGQGTGLGLTISRRIAQSHLGTLRLVSGASPTCFELVLPLAENLPERNTG